MASTGEQLGRYHLVRKLATGGMAEVFLAKVSGPGGFEKSLVIKRILPNLAKNPEFVSMFLQEARLAAQFAHPAVVQIFDFGEVNSSYFLAMEFVDGPNLRTLLQAAPDRRLPLALGARIIEEACEGLAYVHEFADPSGKPLGLMHCDVSTDNLLIARNGTVKVVDFGLATTSQAANATPGTVKGKMAYMPPEQIIGEADLRADVYALGVILYELAAGTRPYEQMPDQQLLAAIIKTDPVPLRTRRPDVPAAYARIVEKAMAKNLSERFQTCHELANALQEFIDDSGERAGARQIAALVSGQASAPANPAAQQPVTPAQPQQQTPTPRPRADPFAAFGKPVAPGAVPSVPAVTPPLLATPPPSRAASNALFDQFFSDLVDEAETPPAPTTLLAPAAPKPGTPSSGLARAVAPSIAPVAATTARQASGFGGARVSGPFAGAGPSATSSPSGFSAAGSPSGPSDVGTAGAPGTVPATSSPSGFATAGTTSAFAGAGASGVGAPGTPAAAGAPNAVPATSSPSGFGAASPSAAGSPTGPFAGASPGGIGARPTSSPSGLAAAQSGAEVRAAVVLADATAMRLYEAGQPLATPVELELVRREFERDEGLHLAVRFACSAPRVLKAMDNAEGLVGERVLGAVEGLLLAEAYGLLATMLERLRATVDVDAQHRWVFELAYGQLATSDQARRLAARLREAPPADPEGLAALIPWFGAALAPLWLELFETLELPASRDAVLPGLAGLAALNVEPFHERIKPKRPRRISELVYCLEKGRTRDRQRVVRELFARLDPSRQREVLVGLARAGTDDAWRQVCQATTDEAEETRLLAYQLLGKHFPERAFEALSGLISPQHTAMKSEAERRALWVAVGSSTAPAAFEAIAAELAQKPSLLNRARVEARKVDVLEGVAAMKTPAAAQLLRRTLDENGQGETVRAAAERHLRAAALIEQTEQTTASWAINLPTSSPPGALIDSRRWDRTPSTWRDVVLELTALASASRLLALDTPTFDVAFARLQHRLDALLKGSPATISTSGALLVNNAALSEGADPAIDRALKGLLAHGIAAFSFARRPPRAELEHLARWLAAGPAAEGIETPSVTRQTTTNSMPRPAPHFEVPPLSRDLSREAMIRYVELVLSFRGWLAERKANPEAQPPDVRQALHELAAVAGSRQVRFIGLVPRERNRDAELFHGANVMMLTLAFGAELGLSPARLVSLATVAFFSDVGNLDLRDELFLRAGRLTDDDQRELALARRLSARFPFAQRSDQPLAAAWATALAEQDVDWGTRERPGLLGAHATVGLAGSVLALARAWETLTTATSTREAFTPAAALEALTQKVAHRFRPEVLPLFARFVARATLRPLTR